MVLFSVIKGQSIGGHLRLRKAGVVSICFPRWAPGRSRFASALPALQAKGGNGGNAVACRRLPPQVAIDAAKTKRGAAAELLAHEKQLRSHLLFLDNSRKRVL